MDHFVAVCLSVSLFLLLFCNVIVLLSVMLFVVCCFAFCPMLVGSWKGYYKFEFGRGATGKTWKGCYNLEFKVGRGSYVR